jgi:hypothetical protein
VRYVANAYGNVTPVGLQLDGLQLA